MDKLLSSPNVAHNAGVRKFFGETQKGRMEKPKKRYQCGKQKKKQSSCHTIIP